MRVLAVAAQVCVGESDLNLRPIAEEVTKVEESPGEADTFGDEAAREAGSGAAPDTRPKSPRAIAGLRDLGYPADKIKHYGGGMPLWQLWGLTAVVPRQ